MGNEGNHRQGKGSALASPRYNFPNPPSMWRSEFPKTVTQIRMEGRLQAGVDSFVLIASRKKSHID